MRYINRRTITAALALGSFAVAIGWFATSTGSESSASAARTKAVMYKPLQCGCCDDYARYLERHGFEVEIESLRSLAGVKRTAGVPEGFEGCHTLLVEGYAVDGLVPIGTLQRLLAERPAITGITLPGMPWGAPGMEQRPKEGPLVVYAFDEGSEAPRVYARE